MDFVELTMSYGFQSLVLYEVLIPRIHMRNARPSERTALNQNAEKVFKIRGRPLDESIREAVQFSLGKL